MQRRWILVVGLFILLSGGYYTSRPYVDFALRYFHTENPICPAEDLVRWVGYRELVEEEKDRILRVSRRLDHEDKFSVWETPAGRFLVPEGSDYNFFWNLAEQSLDIYAAKQFIRKGAIVLDAGAHVGAFIGTALRAGAAKVIAIEPAPENLICLRENFRREIQQGRVVVIAKGVWNEPATLQLKIVPGNSGADSFVISRPEARPGPQVEVTTIDLLVRDLRLARVDFIKLDIEGAEYRALEGARQTLLTFRPVVAVAVYHRPGDPQQISSFFRRLGTFEIQCIGWEPIAEGLRPTVMIFRPKA